MKILKTLFPAIALFFMAGCSNADKEATSRDNNAEDSISMEEEMGLPQVEVAFPEWFRHLSVSDSSFSTHGFEGGQTEVKTDSANQDISNATIVKYMPYLLFNSDSTFAIDLITNNYVAVQKRGKTILAEGGPDFEVGLIDLRNNKRKQLLFFGTMGTVMDAGWLDNNTVMIAGANEMTADSIRPVIWKYEIPTNAWFVFTYEKMIPNNASSFPRRWMKEIED